MASASVYRGRRMLAFRFCPWLLVAVGVFAVFVHVCAAPFHVHAATVTTHAENHADGSTDDAAHGGSCDAVRAAAGIDVPALVLAEMPPPLATVPFYSTVFLDTAPAPSASPPLFLLHAALLI